EMAEVGEAAGQRNLRDAVAGAQRVGQIAAAFVQPTFPYPIAHGCAFRVEKILQITGRNADSLGDPLGVERVVVQVAFNDRLARKISAVRAEVPPSAMAP